MERSLLEGRFRLESEKIYGGMGTVIRALDLQTNEHVAVKISENSGITLSDRFQQEANCLAEMAHPAIVRYIAHGKTSQGQHYLAMEWLDGETLEDRLQKGPILLPDVLRVARRIAEALDAAHTRGVIHRDIKPANIFLPDGDLAKVKLLDFGIARRVFEPTTMRMTQSGSVIGTAMYMAPEQAQGAPDIDGRVDIYALGCVLFESATGALPFGLHPNTESTQLVMTNQELNAWNQCRHLSPKLADLITCMVAKKPANRPASVRDVLAALDKITVELRTTGVLPVISEEQSIRIALADPTGPTLISVLWIAPSGSNQRPCIHRLSSHTDLGSLLVRRIGDANLDEKEYAHLNQALSKAGAILTPRDGGFYSVTVSSENTGNLFDLLVRTVQAGLRLKQAWPDWSIAVGAGQFRPDELPDMEGLYRRTASLIDSTHIDAITLDCELRRILHPRFEITYDAGPRAYVLFEKSLRDAPRTFLGRDVPCVGREREINNLEGLYSECVEESSPRVMIVQGAAGLGKSRLAYEFLSRIQRRGDPLSLLVGRTDPVHADISLGLVGQALRESVGITGTESEEIQQQRLHAHVLRSLPKENADNIAAFLGEIAGVPFPDEHLPQLKAARQDARLMADQTLAAWVDWLEAESAHHPVLIIFEDLHWGDRASVTYVDAALRVLRDRPILVLALGRPEMDIRFPALWRERYSQRIILGPLGHRAVDALIQAIGINLTSAQRKWVIERGQGNPYYLEELLYSLHENPDESRIPDTVVGMVRMRFDAVGEGGKVVIRAGSVFGQNFLAGGVRDLVGDMDTGDVDRWLEILVSKEILFNRSSGRDDEFSFRHALHYETAYALLSPDQRVIGHRLAGEFLEQLGGQEPIVLAGHFEKGHEPKRAIRWLRVAAEQALEVDDLDAVLERVKWGVRLGAVGDDLFAFRIVESEVCFWQGDYKEAARLAKIAQASTDPHLRLRATGLLIDALGPQAQYQVIQTIFQELLAQPEAATARHDWLKCLLDATAYLSSAGDFSLARSTLALLEAEKDSLTPYLLGRCEFLKANVARIDGRLAEYVRCYERAVHHFEEMGNLRMASMSRGNLACGMGELGLLQEAEAMLHTVLRSAEKRNLKYLVGGVLPNLCGYIAYQGRLSEAREYGRRALDVTRAQDDHRFQGFALLYLSVVESIAEDFHLAETYGRQAIEIFTDNPALLGFAQALVARALLGQGLGTQALALAKTAFRHVETIGGQDDGEGIVRLTYVECLLGTGHEAEARMNLSAFLKDLQKRSLAIDEPAWRLAFIRGVPEHKRMFELGHRLGLSVDSI
jgi:serine/threonine protein kinase/tetratricopeptide (TPR) repeat protein